MNQPNQNLTHLVAGLTNECFMARIGFKYKGGLDMSIGLDVGGMTDIFHEEYRNWSKILESDRAKMAKDYINMGIPEQDANIQSMLQIRWEASVHALIATLTANNAQIEI